MLGHGHGQQLAHFFAHGVVFRHLWPELPDLLQQIVSLGSMGQGAVQIQLEGLHLFARDQIHPSPGLLEPGQLAKGLIVEGTASIRRGLLQLLPEAVEIRMQLGQHRFLQLLFKLMTSLLGHLVLIPVMLNAGTGHYRLFRAGMNHAGRPAAQPDEIRQCQPILLTHASYHACLKSVHFGLSGATVRSP